MALFVREYDWMWTQLDLSLAECRVFAYIYGLTNAKTDTPTKGYCGSKRQLAALLGLNNGATKRILDALTEKHLIVCTDNVWQSVVSGNEGVASGSTSVASGSESAASGNESAASGSASAASGNSPHTPLININNNYSSCSSADKSAEQPRQQQPTIFFEKDLSIKFDYTSPVFKLMPPPYPLVEEFVVKHKQYPKRLAIDFWTYNEARGWRDRNGALYKDWGCLFVRYLRKE